MSVIPTGQTPVPREDVPAGLFIRIHFSPLGSPWQNSRREEQRASVEPNPGGELSSGCLRRQRRRSRHHWGLPLGLRVQREGGNHNWSAFSQFAYFVTSQFPGSCAQGFGACCTILVDDCTSSNFQKNLTYIVNPSYPSTYSSSSNTCKYTLSKVSFPSYTYLGDGK